MLALLLEAAPAAVDVEPWQGRSPAGMAVFGEGPPDLLGFMLGVAAAAERGAGDTSILCILVSARVSICWWWPSWFALRAASLAVPDAKTGSAGAVRVRRLGRGFASQISPGRSAGAPLAST